MQIPLMNAYAWTLGRSSDNDIPLSDRCASRNHAMFQMVGANNYFLIDLGSRNGSFVNGKRVTIPVSLKNGDHIILGETNIEFYCPEDKIAEEKAPENSDTAATAVLHTRQLITVLVVDIRDFTQLTQQMDEQILSEVIGTWFRRAGQIIDRHGSWVDKYIGDAVMTVWIHQTGKTADIVATQDMLKVYRALYEIYQMSDELNQHFALPLPIRVGAGINTGYAMVGQMGTSEHPDYTALGDTVNAAFRLESSTKQMGKDIAIGAATYSHTPYAAVLLPFKQYSVELKGYSSPSITYAGAFDDLRAYLEKLA
ncbi:adenylate/guanylate cyclase domain-containing protein [Pseudanabaena sp. FACHB-723]|uniref:Adenylate/guanylate cyclase domain-containing protein n=2 Tax=Pseudanabaena mucicola TaxID=71190 RepID=A0ABR7ZVA7_9CYAN|nr:adenylate/guanylate cyclase domain-containing protein [Pseudanabaena mucicola FACHB-723]